MPATCRLRSHTQGSPLIFHREEERDACIILTEPEWRETSLCYLHTHTHCQRFIVQGFNGALTHTSLSVYLSCTDTNTHPSIIHFLLLFSKSSPYLPSISHPFLLSFHPPPPSSPVSFALRDVKHRKNKDVRFGTEGETRLPVYRREGEEEPVS